MAKLRKPKKANLSGLIVVFSKEAYYLLICPNEVIFSGAQLEIVFCNT